MGSRASKCGRFPCISLGRCCGFLLAGFPAAGISGDVVMCCSLGTPPCTGSPVAVPVTPSAEALRELGGGCYPRLAASQPLPPATGTVQGLKPGVFCSAASSAPPAVSPSPCSLGEAAGVGHCEASPQLQARHRAERQNAGLCSFFPSRVALIFLLHLSSQGAVLQPAPASGLRRVRRDFPPARPSCRLRGRFGLCWGSCPAGGTGAAALLPPLHDLHGLWSHAFNGLAGILFK